MLITPSSSLAARLSLAFALALVPLSACVSPRNIREPVEGALEYTFPDSAAHVLDAAAYSITDEGMDIGQLDRKRSIVESAWTDVGALKASVSRESYPQNERIIRFRLRTRRILGGTTLIGEVVSQPLGGGGRAMERMVPRNHAGREVLVRLFRRTEERLVTERARRAREAQDAAERGSSP